MTDRTRQAWEREYAEIRAYTTSYRMDLDRGVLLLGAYLDRVGASMADPVLECGCGMGRNLIPLARSGHRVLGLDHAEAALARFRERAVSTGTEARVGLVRHDLRSPLPLDDRSAGTILDVTAIDNLVDPERRRRYGEELARVLRPGGHLLVVTFSVRDGYYRRWLDEPAGDRVVEDPNTGIRNQLFTAATLDATFPDALERRLALELVFEDEAARRAFTRHFLVRVFRRRS